MKKVISVRFKENGKSYYFDPADADIRTGDYVIVETARGIECGEVVQGVKEIADAAVPKALKPITRMADSVDVRRMRQNREDEKRAYRTCQDCIARHGLEMKLVEAEYTLDRSKIMFYFTADGRVDFRELVKDLAGIFHTRIELRQIGVRDESKMIGSLGICSQPPAAAASSGLQPFTSRWLRSRAWHLLNPQDQLVPAAIQCSTWPMKATYEYLNNVMPMVGSTVHPGPVWAPWQGEPGVRLSAGALRHQGYRPVLQDSVCRYISGGKRAPRRPDPDDDYSGVRNAPVVASSDDDKRCAGCCAKSAAREEWLIIKRLVSKITVLRDLIKNLGNLSWLAHAFVQPNKKSPFGAGRLRSSCLFFSAFVKCRQGYEFRRDVYRPYTDTFLRHITTGTGIKGDLLWRTRFQRCVGCGAARLARIGAVALNGVTVERRRLHRLRRLRGRLPHRCNHR